jgi:autotransporter-associated beta strand protein
MKMKTIITIAGITVLAAGQSLAQTWVGGDGHSMGNVNNWVGGLPDITSENSLIRFDSTTNLTPDNDEVNSTGELRFEATAGNMVLGGNAITVGQTADGDGTAVSNVGTSTATINLDLTIRGHNTNSYARNFYVADGGTMIINGIISSDSDRPEMVKTAGGTLILTAANIHTSGTRINGGTVYVNNTTGSGFGTGPVVGASAGTLGGSGSFTGNYHGGAAIRPGTTGNGDIGKLTAGGNVMWQPNDGILKSWEFDLGTAATSPADAKAGSSTQDQFSIGGDFTKNTAIGTTFRFDFQGGGEEGWYKLVDWAGTTDFDATDFTATNLASGLTGSFQIDSGALYLNVIPE